MSIINGKNINLGRPTFPISLPPEPAWRYLNKEKFNQLLNTKSLWFSRSDLLGDHLEGSMHPESRKEFLKFIGQTDENDAGNQDNISMMWPMAKGVEKILHEQLKYCFITCWHANSEESYSMWKLYGNKNESIAVKSTIGRIIQAIGETVIKREELPEPSVNTNYEHPIFPFSIQLPPHFDRVYYGNNPPNSKHLIDSTQFLFRKDKPFESEREIRGLIDMRWLADKKIIPDSIKGLNIPLKLSWLIESIVISPYADPSFADWVKSKIFEHNLEVKVRDSVLKDGTRFEYFKRKSGEEITKEIKNQSITKSTAPKINTRISGFSDVIPKQQFIDELKRFEKTGEKYSQMTYVLLGGLGMKYGEERDYFNGLCYLDLAADNLEKKYSQHFHFRVQRVAQYYALGEYKIALTELKKIRDALEGDNNEYNRISYCTAAWYIGLIEKEKGNMSVAFQNIKEAHQEYKRQLGAMHPLTITSLLDRNSIH